MCSEEKGRRNAVRVLLFALLLIVLLSALYLGEKGLEELSERRAGESFYAQLAQSSFGAAEDTDEPQDVDDAADADEQNDADAAADADEQNDADAAADTDEAQDADAAPETHEPNDADAAPETHEPNDADAAPETDEAQDADAATDTDEAQDADAAAESGELEPTRPPSEMDFDALRKTCPDAVGWLRIEGTAIDYPIVQGEDNDYYLYHLADGTPNGAGSIMMDCVNDAAFADTVSILHGHHMRNGSMFGDLSDYKDEEYYLAHPRMRLLTPDGDYDVAVFAAYTVNGYSFGYPTSFANEDEFALFMRKALSSTGYETDVEVDFGDRLLLLSTCAYSFEGARYVVIGKLLEECAESAAPDLDPI